LPTATTVSQPGISAGRTCSTDYQPAAFGRLT